MNQLWSAPNLADPHAAPDKAARVRGMFAAIAPTYDLNNRLHSLGRDQAWRRAAVSMAQVRPGDTILDAACGTGDLSIAFARTEAARILGADFTAPMLAIARTKTSRLRLSTAPTYHAADAMRLPLPDACCDVVSIAFGIRNVADPAKALAEFYRVLRPGGRLIVLEFGTPTHPVFRRLHGLYCGHIMPRTATWIARDTTGAYRYLPRSVSTFLSRDAMTAALTAAGFTHTAARPLTLGIALCYRGMK